MYFYYFDHTINTHMSDHVNRNFLDKLLGKHLIPKPSYIEEAPKIRKKLLLKDYYDRLSQKGKLNKEVEEHLTSKIKEHY